MTFWYGSSTCNESGFDKESEENVQDNNEESQFVQGAKKLGRSALNATKQAAGDAAKKASEKTKEVTRNASISAKKSVIAKLQNSIEEDEAKASTPSDANGAKPNKSAQVTKRKVPLIPILVIVAVAFVAIAILRPAVSSVLGAEDFETKSQLKESVEIDELSSAKFTYKGIAEKHRDNSDDVEYRVLYETSVTASVDMSQLDFKVNARDHTVTVVIPEYKLSFSEPEGLKYLPSNPHAELQEILNLCKEDAEHEAKKSKTFNKATRDNMHSIIEALTKPIISSKGYTLVWADNDEG